MPLVFACISPHGGHLLAEPGQQPALPTSFAGMNAMTALFQDAAPDLVAFMTPHGYVYRDAFSYAHCARMAGDLDGLHVAATGDLAFTWTWQERAEAKGVPCVSLVPETDEVEFDLDWGVTIPYTLLTRPTGNLPIVVTCPAPGVPRDTLIQWGVAFAEAAQATTRRVALVVSADQGHGHAPDGPYGFAPESAEYDQRMCDVVAANRLTDLLEWDAGWVDRSLADSYWQTLSLVGVEQVVPLNSSLHSYEVDHYFGMLCASFVPSAQ